jgi:hypothetical protein
MSLLSHPYYLSIHICMGAVPSCPKVRISVKRDLYQCQKRPISVSKETYISTQLSQSLELSPEPRTAAQSLF